MLIPTLASMNPLRPCHHLPTPPKASSQPCSEATLLPQNKQTTLKPTDINNPKTPGTPLHRRQGTETPRSFQPSTSMSACANTCHDLLAIEPCGGGVEDTIPIPPSSSEEEEVTESDERVSKRRRH